MASPSENEAASELVMYAARLVRIVRRSLSQSGSTAQVRQLSVLEELGPSTVTEIAAADGTSQPTATTAIKALEARGLVERRPHPRDSRASLIELSDLGRAALQETRTTHGAMFASHLDPYTLSDLQRAVAVLRHFVETASPTKE